MEKKNEMIINLKCIQKNKSPNLSNVYGSDTMKESLDDIVMSMQNPMLFMSLGVIPTRSFLFYGKPGNGKTMTFNAISHTLADKSPVNSVIVMNYDIGSYGTAHINMGAVRLQKFFDAGHAIAKQEEVSNVLYWIDECESLMGKRQSRNTHKEDDKLLNTLMTNLQRINDECYNEYIFFATNFYDVLDEASIRSGRINDKIEFKLPDVNVRKTFINELLEKKNKEVQYKLFRNYNIDNLTELSNGFSYADISTSVEKVVIDKVKKELRKPIVKGIIPPYYINGVHIENIFKEVGKNINKTKQTIGFI